VLPLKEPPVHLPVQRQLRVLRHSTQFTPVRLHGIVT
jgi:hypothetical protein